jgi:phospholipase/carboxylesterase
MRARDVSLGGLSARVVEPEGGAATLNVVLCHGYGAPAADLVSFAADLGQAAPALRQQVRWVFPAGPLSLEALGMWGSRAWWHLDMARLMERRTNPEGWAREVPEGLLEARQMLEGLLAELATGTGLPLGRTVLGGFSQGAMVTTDVALRAGESPAGLCILSGALIARQEWAPRVAARRGVPVFLSHGRYDDLLPFAGAEALRALLEEGGLPVQFVPFEGPHTIFPEVLEALAGFLAARL